MAENNSSAPLKTAEGAYPALPAGTYASAYHSEATVFSAEEMRAYAAQAVAAQAASAAVAVPDGWRDFVIARLMQEDVIDHDGDGLYVCSGDARGLINACMSLYSATPALPATGDSSAGDLARHGMTPLDKATQDQIASVMLQHGTPEQQLQALATCCKVSPDSIKAIVAAAQAEVQAEPVAAKFFSFDPADDLVFHDTEDDARSAAHQAIDLYRDEAADGWAEEVERVCWGRVIQQAAENVLPDNFPPNAFSAGVAGSLPSVDYVLTPLCAAPQAQPADALDADQPEPADLWYLQDTRGYVGNDVLWWAKDGNGYTTDISKAHAYTRDEAFCQAAMRGTDRAWPKAYIDGKTRPAVDMQYIDHQAAMAAAQEGGKA